MRFIVRLTCFTLGVCLLLLSALLGMLRRAEAQSQFITFTLDRALYTVRTDGTGLREIMGYGVRPQWLNEGEWLAFVTENPADEAWDIYRVHPNGNEFQHISAQTRYQQSYYQEDWFSWSPDGNWLVFANQGDIYRVPITSDQWKNLTQDTTSNKYPAVSPDSQQIAFISGGNIHVMNLDGTERYPLTENAFFATPLFWSPDQKWLLTTQYENTTNLIRVEVATGIIQPITEGIPVIPEMIAWSPDSQAVAFGAFPLATELYVLHLDQHSELLRLTQPGIGPRYSVNWSPDGAWLTYPSRRSGGFDLYKMRPDGTERQPILEQSIGYHINTPLWSPPLDLPFRPTVLLIAGLISLVIGLVIPAKIR